jgi:outer membrane protein assembly factor BamA
MMSNGFINEHVVRTPKFHTLRVAGIALFILLLTGLTTTAQTVKDTFPGVLDVKDLVRKLILRDTTKTKSASTTAILPIFGYNPSLGFQLGLNMTNANYFGDPATTTLSVSSLAASVSTKGVITAQLRHNTFTNHNKWNFQGNWQLSKFITFDYGLGTGYQQNIRQKFAAGGIPVSNDSGMYPIRFLYIRFNEKFYRKLAPFLSAGAGLSFDIRRKIEDEKLDSSNLTPHYIYSKVNSFDPLRYSLNGITLNVQYITRDHPNRAYKGIYADLGFRVNTEFLGSTTNSIQWNTELRSYFSLSRKNPEHVLAFWHWGRYRISGTLPYLDLPGTGGDVYNRSGRAYTLYRFKGPSYFYLETEYRFPITRNKLLSGVFFLNGQTASDQTRSDLFEYWEPGAGAGLRILFNKHTRTNMCIDYAVGRNGANGLFFGLNEVF